jgi:Flp pilus assembly protein protease CpaA
MFEEVFLIILGFIGISFATIEDLRKREIANWINFSLIIFALGFRFFYSLFALNDFNFFYQGLIGFCIFFILGNVLYYSRVFAGGDAKLMIALGPLLPLSGIFFNNLNIFVWFFLLFLVLGAFYGIIVSFILGIRNSKNFKKEFSKQFKEKKKLFYFFLILGLLLMIFSFKEIILFYLGIIVFIFPYLYISAKSIDEACMIKSINPSQLTEGDWLYKDVKLGKKLIKASWEGVNKREIELLKKSGKKILIRKGIPFTPVFWFSFLILIFLWKKDLLFSFFLI